MLKLLLLLLSLVAPAVCAQWKLSGPFGGSAKVIALDPANPNVLLVGTSNSLLYRSTNGGKTWEPLPFPKVFMGNVMALAVDPLDPNRYFAGAEANGSTQAGLYVSRDAGRTWQSVPALTGFNVGALAIWNRDPRRILAGTRRGAYLSVDGGQNWIRITPAGNPALQSITAVAVDPADPSVMYVGTTHLPWKTVDGGKTWKLIHTGMLDDSDVFSIHIQPDRPQRVLLSACSGLYSSENGGQTWKRFSSIPMTHRRTHAVTRDPQNPNILYAGTTLGLFKSETGGLKWRQVNNLHVMSVAIDPAAPATLYLTTERNGIWKSADHGETVTSLNDGFVNRKVTNLVAAGKRLYLTSLTEGGQPAVFRSGNLGASWEDYEEFRDLASDGRLQLFGTPLDDKLLFASNEKERKFWRSTDAGRTWAAIALPVPKPLPPGSRKRATKPIEVMAPTAAVRAFTVETLGTPALLLAGTDKGLYRSKDRGVSWELIKINGSVLPVQAIYAAPNGSGRMVIKTFYSMYLTEDAGAAWKMVQLPVAIPMIYDVGISPAPGGSVLLATPTGLYVSRDSAQSWAMSPIGLPNSTVSSVRFHPGSANRAYAVQFGKVHQSDDGGTTWAPVAPAEGETWSGRHIWFAPAAPDRLFAVTADNGVYYLDLAGS